MNNIINYSDELISMLRCPSSKSKLRKIDNNKLETIDGKKKYDIIDGIIILVPEVDSNDYAKDVIDYYNESGWDSDDNGVCGDTYRYVDIRPHCLSYTKKCNNHIDKLITHRTGYILDAGSGAIPHEEYLNFHKGFKKRICLDLSFKALLAAKKKLGDNGVYILGSIANIPLHDDCVDTAISCHVVYHVPAEKQYDSFEEIGRVLKPGSEGFIVYKWDYSPIQSRMVKIASTLELENNIVQREEDAILPALYFHAFDLQWFESRDWSFSYKLLSFRVVDNGFMKRFIKNGLVSRLFLKMLWLVQKIFPGLCGRYGMYPLIQIVGK